MKSGQFHKERAIKDQVSLFRSHTVADLFVSRDTQHAEGKSAKSVNDDQAVIENFFRRPLVRPC